MSIALKIWSDFVCPFCMIAEVPLAEAVEHSGLPVDVQWMPFELRPAPNPTLRPEDDYLQNVWKQSVYPLAAQYRVELKLPSVSPQPHTRLAWEGYQFARAKGKGSDYNHRVLQGFFQRDEDIGDAEVLAALAGELGLSESEFRSALQEGRFREQHKQALQVAKAMDITAVPTMIIGEQRLSGVQPRDVILRSLREAAMPQ